MHPSGSAVAVWAQPDGAYDSIWANRFAAGASFGRSRLIYYLGSVDNWTNFSSKVEQFDQSVPIDYSKNYVYQTLATNMRGFTQNIRNGDRFAVANTELRWPMIRYLANHPLSNNFLNNFRSRPSFQPKFTYDIGAIHGDDILFLFGEIVFTNGTVEETVLSKSLMHAWGTFAKTG